MNNQNNSSSQSNSSPFPKLKPKGSIILHQIPKINESNESNNNKSNISNENTENTSFLSKLKLFDPNLKINDNNNSIRHSKTYKPNDIIFQENEEKEKKDKINEKNEINEIKTNNEKIKVTKAQTVNEDNMNKNDERKKDIADALRLSAKLHFNNAKKMFNSFSGYLKDNYLSKINLNLMNFNLIKKEDKTFNLTKPPNFEEIENHWNYAKLLLDYNILDFTSKFKITIYFRFFSCI